MLSISNNNYCPECFVCHFCEKQIRPGEGLSMKGEKRCCAGCKPFFCHCGCGEYCPEADRIQLDGIPKPYRLGCLKCGTCKSQLYRKDVVVFNAAAYCQKCADAAKTNTVDLSQPCSRCEKSISGSALLALGKQWCADCFTCSNEECGIKLQGKFFDLDGMPYCKDCRVQSVKKKAETDKREPTAPLPSLPAGSGSGGGDTAVAGAGGASAAAAASSTKGSGGGAGGYGQEGDIKSSFASIESSREYAEVDGDDGYTDVDHNPSTEVEIERDYDNSDFSGSTPANILGSDHKVGRAAENHIPAASLPPPLPDDGMYDNSEAGPPPPPDDDGTYDNAEAGALPPPDDDGTDDNAEAGPPPPPDDDGTYDNAEAGGTCNSTGLGSPVKNTQNNTAVDATVDAIVQQRLNEQMAEMEQRIRGQIETEMRQKAADAVAAAETAKVAEAAAAPAVPPAPNATAQANQASVAESPAAGTATLDVPQQRAKSNSISVDDPLNHKPNPTYVSAAAPPKTAAPAVGSEKALLSNWMTGTPDSGGPSKKFKEKRDLPKPRSQSVKPPGQK